MGVRRNQVGGRLVLILGLLAWTGCSGKDGGTPQGSGDQSKKDTQASGHSHERGKMLIADAGAKYHALLTAHLSARDGNELDVFFETPDPKAPRPAAVSLESFPAQARTGEEGELKELQFECAPVGERPRGEKAGTCSHFVAKAPWMKPADKLYVVARVRLDGEELTIRWKDFNPKKYAHHED